MRERVDPFPRIGNAERSTDEVGSIRKAESGGDSARSEKKMAEGEGFEPSVP